MATVSPSTTKGKALFEGTTAFRSHDDAADSKDSGGAYSHKTTEWSGTECEEVHDWMRHVNSLLRSGVGAFDIYNDESAALTAVCVYISGYDTTASRYLVDPADVEDASKPPQLYLLASVAATSNGTAYAAGLLENVDTSGGAVGNPVYATGAAGAWSLTAPAGANVWQIGVVVTVNATTGTIRLFPPIRVETLAESVTVEATPSNYTPLPSGADTAEAHLAGIDAEIATINAAVATKAPTTTKLDDWAAPDDNTDLNVSTSAHGLCPKAPNDAGKFLDGSGGWDEVEDGDIEVTYSPSNYTPLPSGSTTLAAHLAGIDAALGA